jgi:hypothetical protein
MKVFAKNRPPPSFSHSAQLSCFAVSHGCLSDNSATGEPGIGCRVSGVRGQGFGVRGSVFGVRCQVSGVRGQVFGVLPLPEGGGFSV